MKRGSAGMLLFAAVAAAQNSRGKLEILDRVVEAYNTVQGFQLEAVVRDGKTGQAITVADWFGAPDKLRLDDQTRGTVISYHDRGVSRLQGGNPIFLGDPPPRPDQSSPPFSDGSPWPGPEGGMPPMPRSGPAPAKQRVTDSPAIREKALADLGLADYSEIQKHLESARVVGEERVTVDDAPTRCTVVEAQYPHGRKRTFWIDAERFVVVREVEVTPGKGERTIEVQKLDWNVNVLDSVFYLRDLPVQLPRGRGVVPGDSFAMLVHRGCERPLPSEEAQIANLKGLVTMNYTVGLDGIPTDIQVVNPVGLGMDEVAAECLAETQFRPAMKDGKPIAKKSQMTMGIGGPRESDWHLNRVVFHVEKGVSRPVFRKANYPQVYVKQGSATFRVHLTIDQTGMPRDVQVSGSDPKLDKQAKKIVESYRFQPGLQDGAAVEVQADLELELSNGAIVRVVPKH